MSVALHQSAVHILLGRQHPDRFTQRRVAALVAQHRAQCLREAQPGDGCMDIDCPNWMSCPGGSEPQQ